MRPGSGQSLVVLWFIFILVFILVLIFVFVLIFIFMVVILVVEPAGASVGARSGILGRSFRFRVLIIDRALIDIIPAGV
jgi:hypothetical protein